MEKSARNLVTPCIKAYNASGKCIAAALGARKKGKIRLSSLLQTLASLAAAGSLLVSGALDMAAPQNSDASMLLLVNRDWGIRGDYAPAVRVSEVPGQVRKLREEAATALEAMFAAAKAEARVTLVAVSGYRDYDKQERIYGNKLKSVRGDEVAADAYVARPGTSEHQTGLTMDIGQRSGKDTLEEGFGGTRGGQWCRENAWRFGFILRYDEGWEEVTGYSFEPWHFRYVGLEHARRIHEKEMPLEEYLKLLRTGILLDLVSADE